MNASTRFPGRLLCAGFVASLVALATPSTARAGSAGGEPLWARELPPQSVAVLKIDPERIGRTLEAFGARIRPDVLPGERFADWIVAGTLANESPIELAIRPEEDEELERFDNIDRDRPLVVAVSVAPMESLFQRVHKGLPPLQMRRPTPEFLFRAFVPSEAPEALADELERRCQTLPGHLDCLPEARIRPKSGWVRLDVPAPRPSTAGLEAGNAADALEPSTPAVRTLRNREAGLVGWVPASAVWRLTALNPLSAAGYHIDFARKVSNEAERREELRHLQGDVASAMVAAATESPGTREVADCAFALDGAGSSLRFDVVTSYTSYGATIAEAGRVDERPPLLELPSPVVTGVWRYDLGAALSAARRPVWATTAFVGPTGPDGLQRLARFDDGAIFVRAAVTQPLSAARVGVELLRETDLPRIAKLDPYLGVTGGSFAFDLDPQALVRRSYGDAIEGGLALAADDARSVGSYLNLVDALQVATGVSVRAETATKGERAVLKLRTGTDRTFTPDDSSGEASFRASFRGDRLAAIFDVLWAEDEPFQIHENEVYGGLLFFDEATMTSRGGVAARVWRFRVGDAAGETEAPVDLSKAASGLPQPSSRPLCGLQAVAASLRTYVTEVHGVESMRGRFQRRLDGPEGEADGPELDEEDRKAIGKLVSELERRESECAKAGDGWETRVRRIREYWSAVLAGEAKTYPTAE